MPDQKARIGFPDSAFKATAKAVSAIGNSSLENLSMVAIPCSLLRVPGKNTIPLNREYLSIGGLQLLTTQ
jgi:hypothetical protein